MIKSDGHINTLIWLVWAANMWHMAANWPLGYRKM